MTETTFQDTFSEEIWDSTYRYHQDITIDDTFRRVAKAIASVEETEELRVEWEEKFYDMLTDFKVVPGGRIISNAGTDFKGTSLINCFVSGRHSNDIDSIEGISKHLLWQMQTLKSEGGWGENFSYIRPRGSFIHGIGVESPGTVKYMELFDKSSDIITAGSGKKSTNKKAKKKIYS
jgi:ribonucleoside-diphosphate reductase alpha chain